MVQWHKRRRKDLSVAWIDYRKAYDLVDHDLLRFVLETIGFNRKLRSCIEGLVLNWKTRFQLKTSDGELCTELVRYGRGLFQGDCLSCYEFVIITIPISYALYKHSFLRMPTVEGFSNHLLFMDDLKIYANSAPGLAVMIETVKRVSGDIGMELSFAKCAQAHLVRGAYTSVETSTTEIRPLELTESYKYLGINQKIDHNYQDGMVEIVFEQAVQKAIKLCKSKLSGKKLVNAWNSEIVEALGYYFCALSCTRGYFQKVLEPALKRLMTRYLIRYRTDSIERLFMPRTLGEEDSVP